MSDKQKRRYYWLKLKENFFEEDTIEWLEEQPNGKEYCLFYLKLCLKSLKTEGLLARNVGNLMIPYDPESLAKLTRSKVDTVKVAMDLFNKIGLIQMLDSGEIFLNQLGEMVGSETESARQKRLQRSKVDNVRTLSGKGRLEKEIEKEIEIKKDSRKSRKRIYDDDSPYLQLARHLYEKINSNGPIKKPNLQTWADDIRKMVELDERDIGKVGRMIEWCQKDSFWSSNILSAKKLREKYDVMARQANRKPERAYNKPKGRVEELPPHIAEPPKNVEISPEKQAELDRKLAEYLNKEENG